MIFCYRYNFAAQIKCYLRRCYNRPAHLCESFKALMIPGLLTFPNVKGNLEKPKGCGFHFLKIKVLFLILLNIACETLGISFFSVLELQ